MLRLLALVQDDADLSAPFARLLWCLLSLACVKSVPVVRCGLFFMRKARRALRAYYCC